MALIDRFRLDDVEIYKWKCPLCDTLHPTYHSLIGHILFDHTEGKVSPEDVEWAKLVANDAELVRVPRRQRHIE